MNYKLLKELVDDHKMIDVYVENGKIRLVVCEMSPNSIKTVFREMDETKKVDINIVLYCPKTSS